MSSINLETAIIQLYENASLTEELTDNPAVVLLKWGEKQLGLLAQKHSDEEAFESDYKSLRRLMKSMSKFTSNRHTMTEEEKHDYLSNRIVSKAQELGFGCTEADISPYLEKQKLLDEAQNVEALIALVDSAPTPTENTLTETNPGMMNPTAD